MTALENARAALARADAWPRPNMPTEASELLDFVSNVMEILIAEYERLTAPITDSQVEAASLSLWVACGNIPASVVRAALEAAREADR